MKRQLTTPCKNTDTVCEETVYFFYYPTPYRSSFHTIK